MLQRVTHMPSEWTLRQGRDRYLADNGFTMAEYSSATFGFHLFGRKWQFPNPPSRRKVIALHDLHHVLTGYGTDLEGEAEVGAWELRAGCNTPFLWMINLTALVGGLCVAPRRMWRSFRAARGQRSLYVEGCTADEVLDLTIGELRQQLGIPAGGHTAAP